MDESLQCSECNKSFALKSCLKQHYQKIHKITIPPSLPKKMTCGACYSTFARIEELEDHIRDDHNFITKVEQLSFESVPAFLQWKQEIEDSNIAKFSTRNSRTIRGNKKVFYRCNRAGSSRSRVTPKDRKRQFKSLGSCKTNIHCPARITATYHSDGSVKARFCLDHFGHQLELEHIPLPLATKKAVAEKIARHVPLDTILNDARRSSKGELTTRDHLLNRNDLKNIIRTFKLDCDYNVLKEEPLSVERWIEQEQKSYGYESSVILYKAKGVDSSDYPILKTSEFLLGIMTPGQIEVLKQLGSNGVCMDSIYGIGCGYELTTLLVLEESGECFPCAFFISDRNDHIGIEIFLTAIKHRVGSITTKVFMSNMAIKFYTAWQAVMGPSDRWLYCTWDVLGAWQNKLSSMKKEIRDVVYKQLQILLTCTDVKTFKLTLASTVAELCSDAETITFGDYFRTDYIANCELWAYCFRETAEINTNIALERMHDVLKKTFVKGKQMGKTINALMTMVNDKQFNKLIVPQKEKVSYKMQQLHKRHKIATQLSLDRVLPNQDLAGKSWSVVSVSKTDSYVVSLIAENCDCGIRCEHCNACFHKFTCTCNDYCIQSNMCKHVHLVCQCLSVCDQTETDENREQNEPDSPIDKGSQDSEPHGGSFTKTLQNLEVKFLDLLYRCTSQVEVGIVNQSLCTMEAELAAIQKQNIPVNFRTKQKVDVRKKIEPQRKCVLKNTMKRCEPVDSTSEETLLLAALDFLPDLDT